MNFKLTKSSLNFKVYTSPTIPASGTENDIVIISSTPMENWILSSDSPTGEPRNKGDVWIQYSVSGNVFDIMNQHDFMLAITRIYQYISGIWMTVDASRYVGGVWDVVSSAFSATINITYPATSTCVVTNSSGQTVASDTNTGSSTKAWTATVGATGTYTVTATATDGSGKSKSQSVSIAMDGQSESVTLRYELVILDGSIGNGPGNWDAHSVGNGSVSFSSSAGIVVDPDGYTPRLISKKTWDLTDYNSLTFYISRPSNKMNIRCGVGSPHSTYGYITDWDAYTDTTSEDTSFTVIVDIASITNTYIGMEFTYGTEVTISKIIAS